MPEQPPLLIEYPLTGGVDQRTDPRKVDTGKLLRGENAQIDKTGVYTKRYGQTSVDTPLAAGSRPIGYRGVLYAMTSGDIRAFTGGSLGNQWVMKDQLPQVTDVTQQTVVAGNSNASDANIAFDSTSNTVVYVWRADVTGTGAAPVYVLVADATTGLVLNGPTQLHSAAYNPKVICSAGTAAVVYDDGTGNIIVRTGLLDVVMTWAAGASVITDCQTTNKGVYDICPVSATRFIIAYEKNAGTNRCIVASVAYFGPGVASSTALTDAVNGRQSIAVYSTVGERTWVAYTYTTGGNDLVKAATTTDGTGTVTEVVTPFTVNSTAAASSVWFTVGIVRYLVNSALVVWGQDQYGPQTDSAVVTTTSTVLGTNRLTIGILPASKPFLVGTKVYCLAYLKPQAPTPQGTIFLVDLNADDTATANLRARCVAVVSPRQCASQINTTDTPLRSGCLPSVITDAAGNYRTVGSTVLNVASSTLITVTDIAFTFDYKKRMAVEFGDLLYTSGGVVQWFDGIRSAEASFFMYPPDIRDYNTGAVGLVASNGAGALTPSTTYAYKAIYIQRDANGNLHRSEASVAASIAMGAADDTVTVTDVPTYGLTSRQDAANGYAPVGIELYRTTGNGTVYFKLTADPLPALFVNNTGTIQLASYTDLASDASLSGRPILYTYGTPVGELGNVCPPAASILCVHRDRLWLAGCPNKKELWASKRYSVGEAPGWNEGLTFIIDSGGDITGLASMDDKLVVFKEDRIFYITGDGPDPTGQNSDWSDPIPIVTTIGCIEPRSVVMTPLGVAYQSRVGLALLTRGLEVKADWGAEVNTDLTSYPTITSAVLHKTRMEIRFSCVGTSTAGAELRYDYRLGQWFVTKYATILVATVPAVCAVGATTVGTDYYWTAQATGEVFKEDSSTYLDAGNYVSMTFEFADFRGGGVQGYPMNTQGYQNVTHVAVYADYHTPHELKLEYAIDGASYSNGKQWTAANLATLGREQLDFHPPQTKNQAIRIRLSDLTPSSGSVGTGKGYSLASLAFEASPKQGRNRNISSVAKG